MKKVTCFVIFFLLLYTTVMTSAMPEIDQKPMVVIIPSYNNASWIKKNLASVFNQQYDNYRIIYIDDCSQDKTYEMAQQITKAYQQETRTTIIHNDKRYGALANLYATIHACPDTSIIVTLDGDDWLANNQVLAKLNTYYDNNIWMTYGQFQEYPSGTIGHSLSFPESVIKNNAFRTYHTDIALLPASHLRTFYAWLFKKIRLEDLLYHDSFYSMGWDLAFMYPLLEMSGHHQICINEILYIYNRQNPISDCYKNAYLQRILARHILTLTPYAPLEKHALYSIPDKASICAH